MKKKIILIVIGSALLLAACDSGSSAEPQNTWVTPTTPFSSMEASPSK